MTMRTLPTLLALLLSTSLCGAQQLLSGHTSGSPPVASVGQEGNGFLDLDSGTSWLKTSGAWTTPYSTTPKVSLNFPVTGNDTIWYNAAPYAFPQTGGTQVLGTITCLPVWVSTPQHWDRIAENIATLGTNALQIALYASGLDGTTGRIQPQGAPIINSTNIADTGTGNVTWSFTSQSILAGIIFICTAYGDTTVVMTTVNGAPASWLIGTPTAANAFTSFTRGLTYAGTFGTWPNFTGVTMADSIVSTNVPMAGYRVVSVP